MWVIYVLSGLTLICFPPTISMAIMWTCGANWGDVCCLPNFDGEHSHGVLRRRMENCIYLILREWVVLMGGGVEIVRDDDAYYRRAVS